MRYGSVCSGIEAATVAWHPLGWLPVFFAEIAAFPSRVLAHHYPQVQNHGDFTAIRSAAIDLLVGGTPCQSFSVAGLRGGLDDDRGNLALEFCRLVDRARPRWVLWENVPGVLSSGGGRDFGAILGALAELGYGWAYRVLDAQFFGVPQRRRRVFLVGCAGGWVGAAAVLFERQGLRGDPPPSRAQGADVAGTLGAGAGSKLDLDRAGAYVPSVAPALRAQAQLSGGIDRDAYVAHTLRGEGFDASEDGTGRGTPLVPVAFDAAQITSAENRSNPKPGDPSPPLARLGKPHVAFHPTQDPISGSVSPALGCTTGGMGLMTGAAVRRLTPRECERLQGFPDDYTLIPGAADGPRYRALGNSMAVPVMAWIGRRIAAVDQIISSRSAA